MVCFFLRNLRCTARGIQEVPLKHDTKVTFFLDPVKSTKSRQNVPPAGLLHGDPPGGASGGASGDPPSPARGGDGRGSFRRGQRTVGIQRTNLLTQPVHAIVLVGATVAQPYTLVVVVWGEKARQEKLTPGLTFVTTHVSLTLRSSHA